MNKPATTLLEPWRPLGEAFLDYQHGAATATVIVLSSIEYDRHVPVGAFFREHSHFPKIEKQALSKCKGRVLDVGAGAGSHALYLQKKGNPVTAIDVSELAVQVMQERGIQDARCANIFDFADGTYDTILLMMNGIGVAEDLAGLTKLLNHLKILLAKGGQILFDSTDISYVRPEDKAISSLRKYTAPYFGTVHYQMEYKARLGEIYRWLFIDKETLTSIAEMSGYQCHIVYEETDQYLARLFIV